MLLTQTTYEEWEDGDAHSMTPYRTDRGRKLILQNDEDFSAKTPAQIHYGKRRSGVANEGFLQPADLARAQAPHLGPCRRGGESGL